MSDLDAHLLRAANFHDLGPADQVRFFSWYLHDVEGRSHFRQADVTRCFDVAGVAKPGSIGAYLAKMVDRRPPELLKSRHGLRLERRAHDDLAARYGERTVTVELHEVLGALPAKIGDPFERAFLDETIRCFQSGAFRSAIVMCWNLAYSHLCEYVLRSKLADFNGTIPTVYPKEKVRIATRDDFSDLKESQVLAICRSANITSRSVGNLLGGKLTARNAAAHPSGVEFTQLSAESYIAELVQNVVLKY